MIQGRHLHALRRCAALTWLLCCGCAGDDAVAADGDPQDAGELDGSIPGLDAAPPEPDSGFVDASDDGASIDGAGHDDAGDVGDAAQDAAVLDLTAPELVTSSPRDGDDNVAFDGQHTLVFSEPVVLSEGALQLRSSGPSRALAFTAELSDDGLRIALSFDELPELPAQLTLELGAGITDLSGNPLIATQLDFTVPIWQQLGGAVARDPLAAATDVALALDDEGRAVLLSVEEGYVYASRFEEGAWTSLGGALNRQPTAASPAAEPRIALAIDPGGAPLAAFRDGAAVAVVRWNGTAWAALGDVVDPTGGGAYAPALALGASGEPVVAFDAVELPAQAVLRVRALQGASWQTLADLAVDARGVRLAGDVTLAYQEAGAGINVSRWDGSSAFTELGAGAPLPAVSGSFALSVASDLLHGVALTAQGQGTVDWAQNAWTARAEDLGFLVSSQAAGRVVAHDAGGALLAAFSETPPGAPRSRVYAQRFDGARFQPLGPALNRVLSASADRPALSVTATGKPIVAWLEAPAGAGPAQVFVSRFNGAPAAPPYGMGPRAYTPGCLASAPLDGSALTDTGCFTDSIGREPVAGFMPFDVRSPLWSDGAFKRRFVLLPEGATITYRDPGIWTLPAGSIVMKEFSIEARRGDPSTLRPVETRFLIVRDATTWDRYSYQWNQAATAAVLRVEAPVTTVASFEIEDEQGDPAVQTHFFPNRAACLACHQAPGTVLGLQTAMLNRNVDYGGTVDNQLRALQRSGAFGDTFEAGDEATARFMPNPSDTTYPLERRLRAYLHANCSSCHHPFAGMDLQIQTLTADSGLCTKITKGDLDASVIYWRDVLRGNVGQPGTAPMPPLGTLVGNPVLETLLTEWILDPANACP